MRGAGYFTALDSDEVAQMLIDYMPDLHILDWVIYLIELEKPLSSFIAEHCHPDELIQKFANTFPDSVSVDREYE